MNVAVQAAPLEFHTRLQRAGFTLDVDMQLPPTGVTVLFGASGSGKTTCLRVLAGLEPHATGRIRVAGEVWQDSAQRIFRPTHQRAVGYVFQEASLLAHLSVQDNLKYGYQRTPPAQRRHSWDQGLALLGIGNLLSRMPHTLSGGERQRVAIARALATSPRVLLMDEPLASLDAQRKSEVLPWLEQLHAEVDLPVVYVTHSLDELTRLADHVVLLEGGHVRASGTVWDMMARADIALIQGDAVAALIDAKVCGPAPDDTLCQLAFAGGHLLLPQTRAQPLALDTRVRIRIQARDVSLSLKQAEHTSVLNILPATVLELQEDGLGQVLVSLQMGSGAQSTRILSRISALSARNLGLSPGQLVYAQIKGVAMAL